MQRTYTEAQYSTPAAMRWILETMGPGREKRDIDCMARYLSCTLRVGGMKDCRALVVGAINSTVPQ